jgi:hypothetical protein
MKISVTAGNIKWGHFYVDRASALFPQDAWGGPNRASAGRQVTLEFSGTDESIDTDIDSAKRIPRMARGHILRFFEHHSLQPGDEIQIGSKGARHFIVTPSLKAMKATTAPDLPRGTSVPVRAEITVQRIVRDSALAESVTKAHQYRCQVCGNSLPTQSGPYAEGAHIRPLGAPHDGPEEPGNILCLCPNHHVMLDAGSLSINDDFSLVGVPGQLRVLERHTVDLGQLRYHRGNIAYSPSVWP